METIKDFNGMLMVKFKLNKMEVKLVKIAFVVVIAMIGGINVFNAHKPIELSDIAMANVEALAQYEGGEGDKYCTIHIQCFNSSGQATGKYTADSYKGELCTYLTTHEHTCTSCKSR